MWTTKDDSFMEYLCLFHWFSYTFLLHEGSISFQELLISLLNLAILLWVMLILLQFVSKLFRRVVNFISTWVIFISRCAIFISRCITFIVRCVTFISPSVMSPQKHKELKFDFSVSSVFHPKHWTKKDHIIYFSKYVELPIDRGLFEYFWTSSLWDFIFFVNALPSTGPCVPPSVGAHRFRAKT